MRIAVMGAGGLGGYFGARLCLGGAEVHFLARGRHLAALRTDGLRVVGPEPLHVPQVNATDDARTIGPVDLALLCVKLWDTDAALESCAPSSASARRSSRSRTACSRTTRCARPMAPGA